MVSKGQRKKNQAGNKRNQTFGQPGELAASSQIYKGPVISAAGREQADLHSVNLMSVVDLVSSAANLIQNVYNDDPSGYSEWANFAALFHEYRVLGAEFKFYPQNRYSKSTTITRPMAIIVDRSTSAIVANYAGALNHPSAKLKSLDDPFESSWRMENAEESAFEQTLAPVAKHWFKLYADTLSASTTYGIVTIVLLVQFRGRQ